MGVPIPEPTRTYAARMLDQTTDTMLDVLVFIDPNTTKRVLIPKSLEQLGEWKFGLFGAMIEVKIPFYLAQQHKLEETPE